MKINIQHICSDYFLKFCLGKTSSETFKMQQSAFKDYCLIWHSGIWAIPLKCKTFEWYCCFNSRHWSSEDDHRQIRSYHLPHQWDHCAQEITQTEGHLTIKGCWNTIAKEICKWDVRETWATSGNGAEG